MTDEATIAFYAREAPRYTMSFAQAPSRHLDTFLDRLPPEAQVLELGCGGGRDAARMVERGFRVDATDGTPAMVRKANERFDLKARVMLFEDLEADCAYDAIWAHACLLHVPRADVPNVVARIHAALRPGGWHYASFKLGDGEGRCLLGRIHNFPDPDWITAAYSNAGLGIVSTDIWEGNGADGIVRDWIAITARKHG